MLFIVAGETWQIICIPITVLTIKRLRLCIGFYLSALLLSAI